MAVGDTCGPVAFRVTNGPGLLLSVAPVAADGPMAISDTFGHKSGL